MDEKTYLISKDTRIDEDIHIKPDEKLIIIGNDTKVWFGTKREVNVTIEGTLDNHGKMMLVGCRMLLCGNTIRNFGIISLSNTSEITLGQKAGPRMLNAGMIYLKDSSELKNAKENGETVLENAGMIQASDESVILLGNEKNRIINNVGIMRFSGKNNYVDECGNGFVNNGIIEILSKEAGG